MTMLEETLLFDYNVPINSTFEIQTELHPNCPICKRESIARESAPFFSANIPNEEIIEYLEESFKIVFIEKDVEEHKKHVKQLIDDELRAKINEDEYLIKGDSSSDVDDDSIIGSSIRALHARRLFLEKKGEYGKEWLDTTDKLKGWVELKLKKDKKIDDSGNFSVNFGDLMKIDTDEVKENDDTTGKAIISSKG